MSGLVDTPWVRRWETWTAYLDGTNYPGSVPVPPLTDEQVECGIWTYGWWF